MLTPLHHGISVENMEESIAWYEKNFKAEVISDDFEEMLNARVVFMRLGTFEIELFEYKGTDKKPVPEERKMPNEDLKTCGTKHVAYLVEDLETFVDQLKKNGVDIAAGPFPMHTEKVCFIRDNSGVLIELIER
jgi:methylmalonyl-CoA/ethylmalonyl-CoA epimerase